MNTEVHETTKATPYELVFGQRPHTSPFPSEQGPNIVTEEQLEEDGQHTSTPPSDCMIDAESSTLPPLLREASLLKLRQSPQPPTHPPRGQPPQTETESPSPPIPPPRDRLLATTEKHQLVSKTGLVSRCWSQIRDKH